MEAFESKLESFNLGVGGSDSASDFVQGWLTGRMLVGEGFPTMGGSFDNRQEVDLRVARQGSRPDKQLVPKSKVAHACHFSPSYK